LNFEDIDGAMAGSRLRGRVALDNYGERISRAKRLRA